MWKKGNKNVQFTNPLSWMRCSIYIMSMDILHKPSRWRNDVRSFFLFVCFVFFSFSNRKTESIFRPFLFFFSLFFFHICPNNDNKSRCVSAVLTIYQRKQKIQIEWIKQTKRSVVWTMYVFFGFGPMTNKKKINRASWINVCYIY